MLAGKAMRSFGMKDLDFLERTRGSTSRSTVTRSAGGPARFWAGAPLVSGEGELVDVPAAVVLVDGQGLLPGREGEADRHRGPGLPAAGVGDVDVAGQVDPRRAGDVQAVGDAVGGRQPKGDGVGAGGGRVDGVVE